MAVLLSSTISKAFGLWVRPSDAGVQPHASVLPCVLRGGSHHLSVLHMNLRRSAMAFASRRGAARTDRRAKPSSYKKTKKTRREEDNSDAAAEAALEALFSQLEKDLESGSDDEVDSDEITEEDVLAFELELDAALLSLEGEEDEEDEEERDGQILQEGPEDGKEGVIDMDMRDGVYGHTTESHVTNSNKDYHDGDHGEEEEEEDEEDEEDEEEEEDEGDGDEEEDQRIVMLEKWQLRKLAAAAELGRRRVNVKALAADVGLDRSDVLAWLRDPPPELLLMSASLDPKGDDPDEEDESKRLKSSRTAEVSGRGSSVAPERTPEQKKPTLAPGGGRGGPRSWHSNKRLRKEHLATFERVYRQTKRPSNAMVENLVLLTHVPRKRIVEWFDEQRLKSEPKRTTFEGAPEV